MVTFHAYFLFSPSGRLSLILPVQTLLDGTFCYDVIKKICRVPVYNGRLTRSSHLSSLFLKLSCELGGVLLWEASLTAATSRTTTAQRIQGNFRPNLPFISMMHSFSSTFSKLYELSTFL